ncbi:hypothetical protein HDU96_007989 [Phlyctochytrium bullatum]|nr:hypothetical protein HDU96_007989 [Phlyctochytrium bullatum]
MGKHSIEGVPWQIPIADDKSLEAAFDGCQPNDLFWLDVLSINQQSGDELVYSTKEMSVVFARADAVCLWLPDTTSPWPLLGTFEPTKDVVIGMIGRLAGDTDRDPSEFPELRISSTDPEPLSFITILTWIRECHDDIWFRRVWTMQEMVLAKSFVFRGRAFDFRCIDEWYKVLRVSKAMVSKDIIARMPLEELAAHSWDPTGQLTINISWTAFDYSQGLRESVQTSPTGCSLSVIQFTIQMRESSYIRDKVLTMAPLLKCDLALPDFAFDDKSEELAERLWHHTVVRKMANGDISIVYDVNPGYTPRDSGCPITTPVSAGAYFIDDLPYDFWHPTKPVNSKHHDEEYYSLLGVALGCRSRTKAMLSSLNPVDDLPLFSNITGQHCSGVATIGRVLAPFWMHSSFVPNTDEELAGKKTWMTLKIMVVVPARPKIEDDGRMRCWVVGGHGDKVPNSRINDYPGPCGAVWIDWDMVEKDLKLEKRVPVDLPIP